MRARQILNSPIMLGLIDRIAERVMDRLRNVHPPDLSVP
jgi:hypothetical protein